VDAGEAGSGWFSELLQAKVRLVWQDDVDRRRISPEHGGLPGEPLTLADAGPLLLVNRASVRRLAAWIAESGPPINRLIERVRPNLVVDGDIEAFAEDRWTQLRVGEVHFRLAENCDRCVLTTIDPVDLTRGSEPIRTLARRRKWDGKTWFGIRVVPLQPGTLRVGDPVTA